MFVVGAGSAGGVLAARLSEERSVLLLEAGPDYGSTVAGQPALVADAYDATATDHDWGHQSEPARLGRRLPLDAGKIVGGSSATNNVIALRGHPADYDAWVAAGNAGWSFKDVLPAFRRLDGIRQSVALTYLAVARERPNLLVRADAHVDRVAIDDGRAVGVRLAGSGEVLSARHVVVAAGSYGSPAILLRSGLGPAEQLRELGLPVHRDLPGVGRNLHEHPLVRMAFAARDEQSPPYLQTLLSISQPELQIFPSGFAPRAERPTMSLLVGLMKPRSRGGLRLKSPEPSAPPTIDPALLREPEDLAKLVSGVELAGRLADTPPLSEHLEPLDGDDDLESWVLANVGTCRRA